MCNRLKELRLAGTLLLVLLVLLLTGAMPKEAPPPEEQLLGQIVQAMHSHRPLESKQSLENKQSLESGLSLTAAQPAEQGQAKQQQTERWQQTEKQQVELQQSARATGKIQIEASRGKVSPHQILTLEATAYTHTGNTTFTGVYPRVGTIAVDPELIPLGTKMWVEGYGYGVAQDTGGLIKGGIIDLFMETEKECFRWGRRKVEVYILE